MKYNSRNIILGLYILFASLVTIFQLAIFIPQFTPFLVSFTAKTGQVYHYAFMLSLPSAVTHMLYPLIGYHKWLIGFLGAGIILGMLESFFFLTPSFYPLQPLLGIALPAFWIGILNFPAVRGNTTLTSKNS